MRSESPARFDCAGADELARDRAWWEVYEEAFPADEREPPEVILESIRKGVGLAFRARQDNRTIGLATTHLLSHPPAVFLVYMAMGREYRGLGYGGALFEYVFAESTQSLSRRGQPAQGMVWEVAPRTPATEPEQKMVRERRIAFFRRHGGVVLSRPYSQPPVDGVAAVPMELMYRDACGASVPDAGATEALVHALYFEKYSAINRISTETLQRLL